MNIGINAFTLKMIATVAMLIDHIGAVLFPQIEILRIIGRIAFPIFAYMIAEGCVHTKSKKKYFLTKIARIMSIIVNFATIMDIFIITLITTQKN